jgi:hypothetical protein
VLAAPTERFNREVPAMATDTIADHPTTLQVLSFASFLTRPHRLTLASRPVVVALAALAMAARGRSLPATAAHGAVQYGLVIGGRP